MGELKILREMREKASNKKKTIVLPESHDERVLKAAEILTKEKITKIITIGNEEKIREDAKNLGVDLQGVRIIDPEKSESVSDFTNVFYNLRKHKGVTIEDAREIVKKDLFFEGATKSKADTFSMTEKTFFPRINRSA